MAIALPETDKKPGVSYAPGDDGTELPVVDVTHPAFALDLSAAEVEARLQEYVRTTQNQGRLMKLLRPLFLRFMSRRSLIMRGLMAASGGYLSGMYTYLLKLGPDNLGRAYTSEIDRQIAGSISGLAVRLRLQDVAHLLADGLLPALAADLTAPLHLLNIGGGPAIDSLNALIILRKLHPDLLARRPVLIHALDVDAAGPNFGRRALAALQRDDAPLHGLPISFEYVNYDWSDPRPLRVLLHSLPDRALVAVSSEGALFEYGSDEDIRDNLRVLSEAAPADAIVIGSVTRADDTGRILNSSSRAAIRMRGMEVFAALAQASGWRVAERIDRPISHDICLRKDSGASGSPPGGPL